MMRFFCVLFLLLLPLPRRAWRYLAAATLLAACHCTVTPVPSPVLTSASGLATSPACEEACKSLSDECRATAIDECARAEASNLFEPPLVCLAGAHNCADARACPLVAK